MADSQIVDHHGRPIRRKALTQEVANASITGARSVWNYESVANGLTPDYLSTVLRDAIDGDADAYLTLAEEMEERDLHYGSVLSTRKLAVAGLDPLVEAATDDAHDIKLADAVRDLVARPEFGDMMFDCLDGLGKGYAAIEIMWEGRTTWWPKEYILRDPSGTGTLAKEQEVTMEQTKLQTLCLYQLVLGYKLREAEATGEANDAIGA